MPKDWTPTVPTDASILLMGMDLEGALRFHAEAVRNGPSGRTTPGLEYAELWQQGRDGRTKAVLMICDLLDLAVASTRLPETLATEIVDSNVSMRAAMEGRHVEGTFHLLDWNDKPHRLLYDAYALMNRAADALGGVGVRAE